MFKLTRDEEISNKSVITMKDKEHIAPRLGLVLLMKSVADAGCPSYSVAGSYDAAHGEIVHVD